MLQDLVGVIQNSLGASVESLYFGMQPKFPPLARQIPIVADSLFMWNIREIDTSITHLPVFPVLSPDAYVGPNMLVQAYQRRTHREWEERQMIRSGDVRILYSAISELGK